MFKQDTILFKSVCQTNNANLDRKETGEGHALCIMLCYAMGCYEGAICGYVQSPTVTGLATLGVAIANYKRRSNEV